MPGRRRRAVAGFLNAERTTLAAVDGALGVMEHRLTPSPDHKTAETVSVFVVPSFFVTVTFWPFATAPFTRTPQDPLLSFV
jgi:hypothetical protein